VDRGPRGGKYAGADNIHNLRKRGPPEQLLWGAAAKSD
jgi:hypothetical protein